MRQIGARRTRSALIVAGVAVAVAFFVLFSAMSAGLNGFIEEELDRDRTTHIFLESGSPTPFSPTEFELLALVVQASEDDTGVPHHIRSRISLPVSTTTRDVPLTMYGVGAPGDPVVGTYPYDPEAKLSAGRYLGDTDWSNYTSVIPVVMGDSFARAFLSKEEMDLDGPVFIQVGPSDDVDPWWMPDATDYPLETGASHVARPRGPIGCQVVGILGPGQGDDLDGGAFVPLAPVMRLLGQYDASRGIYWTPEIVITIDDGSRVDVADLEGRLVEAVPGIQGTDDHWDPETFKATYGGAVDALDGWLVAITAVLAVMMVAGVSDTMLVSVTDRRREIATLRAVGTGRRQVSRLVLTEVALLASAGLAIGLMAGAALAVLFGRLHDATGGSGVFLAPTSLGPLVLAEAAALALGAAILASAYPASRVARQQPTEALRYE